MNKKEILETKAAILKQVLENKKNIVDVLVQEQEKNKEIENESLKKETKR